MTIFLRGACALLMAAALGGVANAQAVQGGVQTLFEGVTDQAGAVEPAGCNCETDYDTYGGATCDLGCESGYCDTGCCGSGACGVGGAKGADG